MAPLYLGCMASPRTCSLAKIEWVKIEAGCLSFTQGHDDAGDLPAARRSEKRHHVGDLLGLHHPDERPGAVDLGIAVLVAELRLGRAFHDGQDALGAGRGGMHPEYAHPMLGHSFSERLGEAG